MLIETELTEGKLADLGPGCPVLGHRRLVFDARSSPWGDVLSRRDDVLLEGPSRDGVS